ncbi:hypothetical protein I5M32_02725 [Pedobacter sp. SD-b]|uniref:Uncharacterized protein n=1 Tax=Pedobacter segetis TaxID=2793069 RepID=A0ABS1BG70_9SPHI|nr:hypothetical protein [Pedobacter segetis]MBK0381862.1 hypothetical protein [Pedobacter segetis]
MKKILIALVLVSAMAATSCKKDNELTPAKANKVQTMDGSLPKKDLGTWD